MTVYCDEPKTAAELLARYRDVKRRLYPVPSRPLNPELPLVDAETTLAFALAVAAVAADRAREAEKQAEQARRAVRGGDVIRRTPGSTARAALLAVSKRTSVPVHAILGRQRRGEIAAARHEAMWRVRETTKWSLPRVGQFFNGRDHTTVLNSLRRMEDRAARDPELRAHMDGVRRACSIERKAAAARRAMSPDPGGVRVGVTVFLDPQTASPPPAP
jgi:Bacterial dnaA protein helix-turn-helix